MFYGLRLWEGDEGGGGEGGEGDENKAFTQKDLDSAVEKAVGGLKTKNQELLGNMKELSEKLKSYGDIDPKKVREMMAKFENDEDQGLLKEGKIDELVAKKVDKIRAEMQDELQGVVSERDDFKMKYISENERFNNHVVSESVMKKAINAGVRKEALDDVVTAAGPIFKIGEDGEPEARDKDGNLRRIGDKLFTADNWIESLRETKPHYWPDTSGAGASGARGQSGGKQGDLAARIQAAAAAGDHKEYRKLREEQNKLKSAS